MSLTFDRNIRLLILILFPCCLHQLLADQHHQVLFVRRQIRDSFFYGFFCWKNRMMVSYFSVTYKLKLNKGDIKAVQGDSGHSQTDMVTDVYSHIIDEDRKKNAELFEDAFYKKNNLDPNMVSEEVDMELLMKALANPEMRALLNSLAKTMK